MNWNIFNLKYENREQWAFEQMSYLLFCAEFNNKIGLFRYKNQTGLETETYVKDGINYGFQAKYYSTSIAKNKLDIIDSIKKSKSKNNQLNVIYLYLNQELSESTKKHIKKPKYLIEIEKSVENLGITIEWRVQSHFELQLSQTDKKHIFDMFFKLEPSGIDFIDDIQKHNENILRSIHTEISFNNKRIKIDRKNVLENISEALGKNQNVIISGEGGCGKTAIFKEFYAQNSKDIPICIFKATELNINNINDLFRLNNNFTFKQFLETYQAEQKKIFVIDSAEKLAEFTNNEIILNLIHTLKDDGWLIIFSTRYSYLNDLSYHIKDSYQLSCELIDIPILSNEELKSISKEYNLTLPENRKFIERLGNLFYLNEYVQFYASIDKNGNFRNFIDLLWEKRIQNNLIKKDNIDNERDKCLIYIAKERCNTGRFYINTDSLPGQALSQLRQDEIIRFDKTHHGDAIIHDIYEEWALDKIISRSYANYSYPKQFFDEVGNTLPIRRAFRLWLSEQLYYSVVNVERFIHETFTSKDISQFWKDELLVSVLLSDYSETFFSQFERYIVEDNFKILRRILFLLRIACTEISTNKNFDFIVPKGKGWEIVISFIFKYKVDFFENNFKLILPIITDWCNNKKRGTTTRLAGLLALSIIEKTETNEDFYIQEDVEEKILIVVFNAANEIQSELKSIFEKVIENKWNAHNAPYEGLCSKILEKPYIALELIRVLPLSVIKLCGLFWLKREMQDEKFGYWENDMESKYGLTDNYRHEYFPASAFQTPIYWLLKSSFKETLDFIINFTNNAVETYRHSDYGKEDVREIILIFDEKELKQYFCWAFWGMYRGMGSPVTPYLLQSVHMALEKILLEFSNITNPEIIEHILIQILTNSKSSSLTAVVCSVVLAHPDKFYNVALILFKTIELFHIDTNRSTNEFQAKYFYGIGYGLDKFKDAFYTDERLKTCENKHRTSNLESLFLKYQYNGVEGLSDEKKSEFIKKLYEIIDKHKANILVANSEDKSLGILLVRMDRRNLKPKLTWQDNNNFIVEFTPIDFPEELKNQSESTLNKIEDTFKYSSLRNWADFLHNREEKNLSEKYEKYNNNPICALLETKQLLDELNNGRNSFGISDYSTPAFVCSKLMIENIDELTSEDKDFCKKIILFTVSQLFSDNYQYQISDGVEAAVHSLPTLMKEYPDEKENIVFFMIWCLFDKFPLGEYKRICDYVIESIENSKLVVSHPNIVQDILLAFIKLSPIYKRIYTEKRKEIGLIGKISKESILHEFHKFAGSFSFTNISFELNDIDLLDIHELEIVYKLIPSNTKNEIHLIILKKTLSSIIPQLLIDRHSSKAKFDSTVYKIRLSIFEKYAYFLLEREVSELDIYLQPLIDNFIATEETSTLIEKIISAQDYIIKYEQFWYIWNKLYDKFIETCCCYNKFHLSNVIRSYLLAWRWWREGIEEWHSLRKENLCLYSNVAKDLGDNPNVLYSITIVLDSIGSKFINEGIDWINQIITANSSINLGNLESNIVYYLEKIVRKFIFVNKEQIRKEMILRKRIITILDFMIEHGSIHGYLLRESII